MEHFESYHSVLLGDEYSSHCAFTLHADKAAIFTNPASVEVSILILQGECLCLLTFVTLNLMRRRQENQLASPLCNMVKACFSLCKNFSSLVNFIFTQALSS